MKKENFIEFLASVSPQEINKFIEDKGKERRLRPIIIRIKEN